MSNRNNTAANLTGLKNFSAIVARTLMEEAKHAPMPFAVLIDLVINEINDTTRRNSDMRTFEPLDSGDKNVQRRAYDAINILSAIGFIKKDQSRGYRWIGPIYDINLGYPCVYNPLNPQPIENPAEQELKSLKQAAEEASEELTRLNAIKAGLIILESKNKMKMRSSDSIPFPFGVIVSNAKNGSIQRDATGKSWKIRLASPNVNFIDDASVLMKLPESRTSELDELACLMTPDLRNTVPLDRPMTPKNMHTAAIVHSLDASSRASGSVATPVRIKRLTNTPSAQISDLMSEDTEW